MSGKATLFRFKFLFSCLKFFLLIFIVFLFLGQSVDLSAQVIIKERVSIYPNSASPITLDGVISRDPHNPVYLRYGGNVKVFLRHPGSQSALGYTTQFWEENLGLVAANKSQYDTVALGHFSQWEKFTFWITELNDPETKYYPHRVLSDEIIYPNYWPSLTNSIWFFIPPIPDDSISNYPIRVWEIDLTRDDNYAAMPPPEILDYFGNPFVPSEEIIIPADGTVYMTVEDVNSNVLIDLYQDMPENQLLLSDLGSNEGETINFGRKTAGDRLRFYIQSGHTVVNGMNLYPKTYDDEFFSNSDSSILFQDLWFEDWTDLFFDNLNCSVYLIPDHYADFPWSMQVQFSPAVLAPGDTANIILHRRNEDGSLETFPDDAFFDVQILDNSEYGTIYCPVWEDTSDFLISIPQVFQFIAKANIDTDSVVVRIAVNVSGVFAGVSVNDNPVIGIERFLPDSLVNAQKKSYRPGFLSLPKSQAGVEAPGNAPPTGPVIEDVIAEDLAFGIGEVLITEEKPLEIMLGETKYFQARYKTDDKLIIEEVIPESNGVPKLNGGLTSDVWGNNPVSVVECDTCGQKMGVYWEKQKPIWDGNTNRGNLATGLIRIIGRFCHKDSTYIVKLNTNQSDDSIRIKVVKPSKLGTTYATAKDVSNNDINIDSLCITKGGELGIPPQFIKGQMRRETSAHYPFYPTYLYEPWTTQFTAFSNNPSLYNNSFYIKKDATNFNPPVPQNHTIVKDYHYPNDPVSVWDMIDNYSTIEHTSPPRGWHKYGDRIATKNSSKDNGILYFYGVYSKPQSKYDDYKKEAYKKYKVNKFPEKEDSANNEAREKFIKYFKDEWNGGITGGTKGLKNIKAQTRIAASYGLLQLTYPTAISNSVNYPTNLENLPEKLLETENLKWSLELLSHYINTTIENENNKNGNWTLGLEQIYKMVWKNWNQYKTGYPDEVLDFANKYKPIK